jgi:predicted peptidase
VSGADGATLGYRLLKPEPCDAAKKYPLVLPMHGFVTIG